jgi:hypothetical protein
MPDVRYDAELSLRRLDAQFAGQVSPEDWADFKRRLEDILLPGGAAGLGSEAPSGHRRRCALANAAAHSLRRNYVTVTTVH